MRFFHDKTMKKLVIFFLCGLFALSALGCGLFGDDDDENGVDCVLNPNHPDCQTDTPVDCDVNPDHESCQDDNDQDETISPTISIDSQLPVAFEQGSVAPDWLDYFSIHDGVDGAMNVTMDMLDLSHVDMDSVGAFPITITAQNSLGNTTTRTLVITITTIDIPFGNCDPNFMDEEPILSFEGEAIRIASYMINFQDPFFPFAKQTELLNMKKLCHTRSMEEHNTTIEWVSYFNDINHYNEIINAHLSGEHPADLYNINHNHLGRLVRAGAVRPITEYVEKYFPEHYWEMNRQSGSWDGELYGVWNERHNVARGIYVNLDLINEYSQANPAELWQNGEWDWAAFERMAQEVSANAPADFKIFGINSLHAGSYAIGSNGGQIINPYTDEFMLTKPETIRALEFMRDMTEAGYFFYDEMGDAQTRAEFVQGNMLMYFGADWISGDPGILKPGSAIQFQLGMVPFPAGPDIEDIQRDYRLPTAGSLYVVRGDATDEEAEAIVQFFSNMVPWADDAEADFRYYQTMEDHMDDLTSLEAYISVSRLGYFEKMYVFDLAWAEPGEQDIAPGIGNLFASIAAGESITATIEAALPSLEARVREALGKTDD